MIGLLTSPPMLLVLAGVILMAWGYTAAARNILKQPDGKRRLKFLFIGTEWPKGAPIVTAIPVVAGLVLVVAGVMMFLARSTPTPPDSDTGPVREGRIPTRHPIVN